MATVNIPGTMTLKPSSVMQATQENYVSSLTTASGELHKETCPRI